MQYQLNYIVNFYEYDMNMVLKFQTMNFLKQKNKYK